jgi:putative inorganic carbon (HCO3(-)) transporter
MTQINSNIILVLGGLNLLICTLLDVSPIIFLISIIFWILLILIFISVETSLLALIFIRPSIDIIGYLSVPDWPAINLGSSVAMITIILSLIYLYQKRQIVYKTQIPFIKILILLLGVYVGLSFTGAAISAGVQESIRVLSFIILYFVGWVYVVNLAKFLDLVKLIIYSSIIPLIVAYIEYFSGSGLYTNPGFENRIAATFGHPNVLAYFSVIILALISSIWLNQNNRINQLEKEIFAIIGILYLIVLLITFTRGAWFGLMLFLFLMSLAQYPLKTIKISSIITGLGLTLILTYNFLASPNILDLKPLDQFPVINRIAGLFNSDPSDSVIWRLNMWNDAYNKALEKPIIGFGTGSSEIIMEQTRGTFRGSLEVHNDYIKIFLEQGIIGFIIYVILILTILATLYYKYIKNRDIYILTIATLMTIIYIVSLWDNLLRGTVLMWIVFLLLGGALHYNYLKQRSIESKV